VGGDFKSLRGTGGLWKRNKLQREFPWGRHTKASNKEEGEEISPASGRVNHGEGRHRSLSQKQDISRNFLASK